MKAAVVKKISNDDSVNWKEYPLEEVLDVIRGISFKSTEKLSEKVIDSVACLRTANVQADVDWDDLWWVPESFVKREEQFVRQHDILMSNANSYELVGKVSLVKSVPTKATLGAFITLLRARAGFDPKFLFYQLRSSRLVNEIRSRASTTTNISNVSTGKLRDIPLFCPPLEQQKQIVAKIEELFSHIDAGIDALKKSKQLLKQYRQSVLKAAVTGELSKEWREQNKSKLEPASKLLDRILQERRQKWEAQQLEQFKAKGKMPKDEGWKDKYKEPSAPDTSDLPELPEGWCWATLPQLGELNRGKSKHRPRNDPSLYGGEYPFIQTGDVRSANGRITSYSQTYSKKGLAQSRMWPVNTLCITIAANIADTAILDFESCFPDSVVGFVAGDKAINVSFLELYIRTIKNHLEKFAPATAQKNINLEILEKVAVPVISEKEIGFIWLEVSKQLTSIDELEKSITAELQRSERLKQSVLQSAFGGELVKEYGDE